MYYVVTENRKKSAVSSVFGASREMENTENRKKSVVSSVFGASREMEIRRTERKVL